MTAQARAAAQTKSNHNGFPNGDERYKAIVQAMKRCKYEKDALLEVLNTAQLTFGYLSEEVLIYISDQLQVPMSQVFGVATFYHMFTFAPLGDHNCVVCTGTACHVKGSTDMMEALAAEYEIEPGETTPDGVLSLTTARCLGSCGLAPLMILDGAICGKLTHESSLEQVRAVVTEEMAAAQESDPV
jgi:bidirectional [NiFe] hydrogenase diaphorase subunit